MANTNWSEDWSASSQRRNQINVLGNVHLLDMAKYQAKDLLEQLEQITKDFQKVYKILAAHRSAQTEGVYRLLQFFPLSDYSHTDTERADTLGEMAERVARESGVDDGLCKILRYAIPMCESDQINLNNQIDRLLRTSQDILHHVTENYDGTGFPNQLSKEQIPFSARVATALYGFYAYVSPKPYGFQMTHAEALRKLRNDEGHRYDPKILDSLERVIAATSQCGAPSDR